MAVSDLTNTTWLINSTTCTAGYGQFDVDFNLKDGEYNPYDMFYIGYRLYGGGDDEYKEQANAILISLYPEYLSVNAEITFTDGTDVTNANLIAWLEVNATQQGGGTSLSVTYNGNTIVNTSSSGTYTLTCANKKMASNVVVTASGLDGKTLTCTYGGNNIINTTSDGTYTLTCANKKASTDIVIALADAPTPSVYTVTFAKYGNYTYASYDSNRQYSLDGTTWNNVALAMDGTSLQNVTSIYFRVNGNGYNAGTLAWTNPTGSLYPEMDYSSTWRTSGEVVLTGNMVVTFGNTNEPE